MLVCSSFLRPAQAQLQILPISLRFPLRLLHLHRRRKGHRKRRVLRMSRVEERRQKLVMQAVVDPLLMARRGRLQDSTTAHLLSIPACLRRLLHQQQFRGPSLVYRGMQLSKQRCFGDLLCLLYTLLRRFQLPFFLHNNSQPGKRTTR